MEEFEFNLNSVYKLIKYAKDYGHGKLKEYGFTQTEHLICTFLYYHAGTSQDDVAEALAIDKTTVAKALAALETKGYVTRAENATNRRKKCLTLTEGGKNIIAKNIGLYDEWSKLIIKDLTPEEKRLFMEISSRMCEHAKQLNNND